jgi:energy-coupling factor transporter ATP-binding protein EcfA2
MTANWPRGSEWRKWDLHLHAPGTKLNDQFGGDDAPTWDAYCRALHESEVQVFGITDYFSADAYRRAFVEFKSRYPDSSKVMFPNVELRTSDVVNKAQEEVNVHLLFNPFRPDCDARIQTFLQHLKTNKTDGNNRPVTAVELSKAVDFAAATTSRQYISDALTATFGKADLLDSVLIVTAANNDGIRPERGKLRKLLITDELDKFSDAFFGGSKNVDYYLANDRAEDKSEITKSKPVLSGCDAHSMSDLAQRLGQMVSSPSQGTTHEPTWIKADPTFEGLKQIIYEPQNRVYIGAEPGVLSRVRERKTRYIESLHVDSVEGYRDEQHGTWFKKERVAFGQELIAIIGNKGNGKSALTDIIGLLANSHNQIAKGQSGQKSEELFSFLNRDKFLKGGCAKQFVGTLNWYEGEPNRRLLDAQVELHLPEKVEYLPQKYLERICANIADDEFRLTLNEVIFRYVKRQDQYGKASLEELIRYLSQQAEEDITLKLQELRKVNAAVVAVEKKLTEDYRKEVEEKLKLIKQELASHNGSKPPEKINPGLSQGESTESTRISELSTLIEELGREVEVLELEDVRLRQTTEQLRQVRQSIERAAVGLKALEGQHEATLKSAGLSFAQIVRLEIDYLLLDSAIAQRSTRISQIKSLTLRVDEIEHLVPPDGTAIESARTTASALSLVVKIASYEREKGELVERLGKPAREYQEYLAALKTWTDRDRELRGDEQSHGPGTLLGLEDEIQQIEAVYPSEAERARVERTLVSAEIFSRRRGLTLFYRNVKESIDIEIAKCRQHLRDYDIAIEAGLRFNPIFFDEVLKFINLSASEVSEGRRRGDSRYDN